MQEKSEQELNDEYLRERPELEKLLWREYVNDCCTWYIMKLPSPEELVYLEQNWYSGKPPVLSAKELAVYRKQRNENQNNQL